MLVDLAVEHGAVVVARSAVDPPEALGADLTIGVALVVWSVPCCFLHMLISPLFIVEGRPIAAAPSSCGAAPSSLGFDSGSIEPR